YRTPGMADGLRSAYQERNRLPARFFNLANERAILTAMEAIRISVCRPEQVVVEFTDALQGGFELAIVVQPLFGRRASVGREAALLWSTPRQDRLTHGHRRRNQSDGECGGEARSRGGFRQGGRRPAWPALALVLLIHL